MRRKIDCTAAAVSEQACMPVSDSNRPHRGRTCASNPVGTSSRPHPWTEHTASAYASGARCEGADGKPPHRGASSTKKTARSSENRDHHPLSDKMNKNRDKIYYSVLQIESCDRSCDRSCSPENPCLLSDILHTAAEPPFTPNTGNHTHGNHNNIKHRGSTLASAPVCAFSALPRGCGTGLITCAGCCMYPPVVYCV